MPSPAVPGSVGDVAATLELRGLRKAFGDRVALDGLTLDVPPGEVVGLLGPNGSGKTTAMRAVFGVVDADEGTVTYGGAPLDDTRRRRFGYMPEERGLYPKMAVREQVAYFGRLFGLSRARALQRADGLLERLGLGDRVDDQLEALSLGNQQRVQAGGGAGARAGGAGAGRAVLRPGSGGGGRPVHHRARRGPRRLHGPVLQPPVLDLVEGICDSVRILHRGRLVLDGTVRELQRASGRRDLRVDVERHEALAGLPGVREVHDAHGGARLRLEPGVDPLSVLDAVRARTAVGDFGVELPSLSELFLSAVTDGDAS